MITGIRTSLNVCERSPHGGASGWRGKSSWKKGGFLTIPTLDPGGTERNTTGGAMEEGPGIGSDDTVAGASTSRVKMVGGAGREGQEITRTGRTGSLQEWSWSVAGECSSCWTVVRFYCRVFELRGLAWQLKVSDDMRGEGS